MLRIVEIIDADDAAVFGQKAAGLSMLNKMGYRIPGSIVVEACDSVEVFDVEWNLLLEKCCRFEKNGIYRMAVRSSATDEDSLKESRSGYYETVMGDFTFVQLIEAIKTVLKSIRKQSDMHNSDTANTKMGIILQDRIIADYSGIAFSSNPVTDCRMEMVINIVKGTGEKLAEGSELGMELSVSPLNGTFQIKEDLPDFVSKDMITTICSRVKTLEKILNYPVDVEWAVQENELFFLQCRPISSITNVESRWISVKQQPESIEERFAGKRRIKLWETLKQNHIRFPDIWLYVDGVESSENDKDEPCILERSQDCKGYSIVKLSTDFNEKQLHPVPVGDKKKVLGNVRDCCRYGIRTFPDYENIEECLRKIGKNAKEQYWVNCFMIQEVYDPIYTGIIRKLEDGYLIELIRGCFVTQGLMSASQYVITDREIRIRKEQRQNSWYKIIEGHVLYCICNDNTDSLVSLQDEELFDLINCFNPVLKTFSASVEFGILREAGSHEDPTRGKKGTPYFIDLSDEDSADSICSRDVNTGILSRGRISGKVRYLTPDSCENFDTDLPAIFFCPRPEISLRVIIEKYAPQRIGFVFEKSPVLCHLTSILREKHIPAVQIGKFDKKRYPNGAMCTLDTSDYCTLLKKNAGE
ncbi:MAG: PEP/pyruvate-binding domain-containing protein [Clostridiales bacterium]|nr:PEP/pyruvate-binding domain-containing protein [Clostridiales bacterium]